MSGPAITLIVAVIMLAASCAFLHAATRPITIHRTPSEKEKTNEEGKTRETDSE